MKDNGKERVMMFCARLPSTIQGGVDLRVQGQILALLSRGPTAVFALNGNGNAISPELKMWRSGKNQVHAEPTTFMRILSKVLPQKRTPYWNMYSESTASELREAIREFRPHVVIVSKLALMPYFHVIKECGVDSIILDVDEPTLDTRNSINSLISNSTESQIYKRYSDAVEDYEGKQIQLVDGVWLASDEEGKKFSRIYPNYKKYRVIQNVVNLQNYEVNAEKRIPDRLLFAASFGYEPNVDAVHFIIDELLPKLPEASLDLVGSNMAEWLVNLKHPNINIVGQVKSVAPYFTRASVALVPLRAGGGTRLKVLEAMASGVPVVSTKFGVEGLGLKDGEDVLIAEGSDEFAESCQLLERDTNLRAKLVRNALTRVRSESSLDALRSVVDAALTSLSLR